MLPRASPWRWTTDYVLGLLYLPSDAVEAVRYTRLNDRILIPGVDEIVGNPSGIVLHGLVMKRYTETRRTVVQSYTVEGNEHKINFYFVVHDVAVPVYGAINCFSLGWVDVDRDYVLSFVNSLRRFGECYWDSIKTRQ